MLYKQNCKFLRFAKIKKSNGEFFFAPLFLRHQFVPITLKPSMGELSIYTDSEEIEDSSIQSIFDIKSRCESFKNLILDRPFYKPNQYIYKFGQKIILNNSSKHNDQFFPCDQTSDDLFLDDYATEFESYLKTRIQQLAVNMGFKEDFYWDLGLTFKDNSYISILLQDEIIVMDVRLYAFKKEIIDSAIVSLLSVIYTGCIGSDFQKSKKMRLITDKFSPCYLKHMDYIKRGIFEGDDYCNSNLIGENYTRQDKKSFN